jgi:hypothetical protein
MRASACYSELIILEAPALCYILIPAIHSSPLLCIPQSKFFCPEALRNYSVSSAAGSFDKSTPESALSRERV